MTLSVNEPAKNTAEPITAPVDRMVESIKELASAGKVPPHSALYRLMFAALPRTVQLQSEHHHPEVDRSAVPIHTRAAHAVSFSALSAGSMMYVNHMRDSGFDPDAAVAHLKVLMTQVFREVSEAVSPGSSAQLMPAPAGATRH